MESNREVNKRPFKSIIFEQLSFKTRRKPQLRHEPAFSHLGSREDRQE